MINRKSAGGGLRVAVLGCALAVVTIFTGPLMPVSLAAGQIVDPPELLGAVTTPNDGFDVLLSGSYALVADYSAGLHVVDISDVTSPSLVATRDTPGLATHLALAGDIVFVADHKVGGVRFINISNKTAPAFAGSYVTGNTAVMVGRQGAMLVVGYLEARVELIDVNELTAPVLIGAFATDGPPREAVIDGTDLFVTDSGFGLRIFDVADPSAPSLVGSVGANRPIGLALDGDVAYVADLDGLKAFDVSDRTAPTLLDAVSLPAPGVRVRIEDGVAVVADHVGGGLQVVDVSTPSSMSLVTGYVTGYYAYGVALREGHAYLVDREGLKIFRVTEATVPVRGTTLGGVKALYGEAPAD